MNTPYGLTLKHLVLVVVGVAMCAIMGAFL